MLASAFTDLAGGHKAKCACGYTNQSIWKAKRDCLNEDLMRFMGPFTAVHFLSEKQNRCKAIPITNTLLTAWPYKLKNFQLESGQVPPKMTSRHEPFS